MVACKRWTDQEIEYIKANYMHKSYKELAEELGRTEKSVGHKLERIGCSLGEEELLRRREVTLDSARDTSKPPVTNFALLKTVLHLLKPDGGNVLKERVCGGVLVHGASQDQHLPIDRHRLIFGIANLLFGSLTLGVRVVDVPRFSLLPVVRLILHYALVSKIGEHILVNLST